ncbi:MAG: hypothetical protein Q8882_04300 [Bacillota bacterium]|nr:hypothetical protein [Bacillota bacterium]
MMRNKVNKVLGYAVWILFSVILIFISFYYNFRVNQIVSSEYVTLIIIAITGAALLWMEQNNKILEIKNPWFLLLAAIFALMVCFMFFGKTFLYEDLGYYLTMGKIRYFLLLAIPVFIYILFSLNILDMLKRDITSNTNNKISQGHFFILFGIQIIILGFYFYALYPGNMSYDTYNQVSQLKGIIPFNTWHPIGHTLFMGLLLKIWDNFASITIFQILIFVFVTTYFYVILLKNKVKWQIVYFTAIAVSAVPSTGINVVTQWKDIPFTAGLLLATLILFKMALQKDYFSKSAHVIEFIICLLIISLFRFNGILAFIAMLLFALIYVIKSRSKIRIRNYCILAFVIFLIFILINYIVPYKLNADLNPSGMKLRPIYQGLSAVYVHKAEDNLDKQSRELIESVCTPEQIRTYYDPYLADTISNNTPRFLKKLSKIKTSDALKMYIEALAKNPGVVIGDKFNLAVSMWSVTSDSFSHNNAYTTKIQKEITDKFKVHKVSNYLTDTVEKIANYTFIKNYLLNTLVWRTGFYLALEFILMLYLIIKKDRKLCLFIPLFCNALIVFLTMPAQDYRYLWFISLLFPFLVLACLSKTLGTQKGK